MKKHPCLNQTASVLTDLMVKLPERLGRTTKSVNDLTKVNLYKYRRRGSFPLISSLFSFCFALDIDPGWFVMIACQVQRGEVAEERALDILSHWDYYQTGFSTLSHLVIAP